MLTPPKAESIDVSPRTFHRGDGSVKRRESRREVAQRRSKAAKGEYARIKAIEQRQKRTFDAYAFVMGFTGEAA
jgi:hypothetical protein